MRLALRWLGWLVALVVVGYFVSFAFRTFRLQDLTSLATPTAVAAMLFAACLYALIIPISGAAWAVLLQRQGEAWPPARLASILAVTQLAKYIPGGVAQPVGRAAMSVQHGMKLRVFTVTVIQESVLTIAASVVVGLGLLLLLPLGITQIPLAYRGMVLAAGVATVLAVFALASGFVWWPQWLCKQRWMSQVLKALGPSLGIAATSVAFVGYCLNYLVIGVGIWVVGHALGLGPAGGYLLLTAAFSLAWLLGFVVPGAPAGLGVREGVMALLLAGAIPQHQILALVLGVRLVTMVGDGICFALGGWGLSHFRSEPRR
jgi:uncharacterized membrane protein YbhN (UPF0104 family)